jgi:hypothetical protein
MRKTSLILTTVLIAVLGCLPGLAQTTAPGPAVRARGLFRFVGMEGGWGKVVTGAPYSAQAVTETTQTLSDGNVIDRKETALVYRDTAGRTRVDRTLSMVGPWSSSGKPPEIITIRDPVAGVNYVLNPATKTAYQMPQRSSSEHTVTHKPPHASNNQVTTVSLGTQMVNGVEAQGTQRTLVIPAGQIGNQKPITIVRQSWYSPQLQIYVLTKRSDPRFGQTTYQLTNIQQGAPAESLFQVPSGYTVQQGRPRMHFAHRPAQPNSNQ